MNNKLACVVEALPGLLMKAEWLADLVNTTAGLRLAPAPKA